MKSDYVFCAGFHGYDQGQGGQGGQGGYMSPGGFGTPQQSQEKKVCIMIDVFGRRSASQSEIFFAY